MTRPPQGRGNQRRRPGAKQSAGVDLWRTPGLLPDLEPIAVSQDVTALIRSLGEPPMNGGIEAAYYFGTVIERAAALATALALSADLLAEPRD